MASPLQSRARHSSLSCLWRHDADDPCGFDDASAFRIQYWPKNPGFSRDTRPAPAASTLVSDDVYSSALCVPNDWAPPIGEARLSPSIRATLAELLPPLRHANAEEWFAWLGRVFGFGVQLSEPSEVDGAQRAPDHRNRVRAGTGAAQDS